MRESLVRRCSERGVVWRVGIIGLLMPSLSVMLSIHLLISAEAGSWEIIACNKINIADKFEEGIKTINKIDYLCILINKSTARSL